MTDQEIEELIRKKEIDLGRVITAGIKVNKITNLIVFANQVSKYITDLNNKTPKPVENSSIVSIKDWYFELVLHKLNTDNEFLIKCIKLLQGEQTSDETQQGAAFHVNGRGWNKGDASYFMGISIALERRFLSELETTECRLRIKKYTNQLVRILNRK